MSESHAVGRGGSRVLGFPNGRHWPPLPETPEGEKQQSSGGLASGLQGDHSPPPPLSACQEIGTRGHPGGKVWSSYDLTISGKQPKASTLGQANELCHLRGDKPKCWRPEGQTECRPFPGRQQGHAPASHDLPIPSLSLPTFFITSLSIPTVILSKLQVHQRLEMHRTSPYPHRLIQLGLRQYPGIYIFIEFLGDPNDLSSFKPCTGESSTLLPSLSLFRHLIWGVKV